MLLGSVGVVSLLYFIMIYSCLVVELSSLLAARLLVKGRISLV